MLDSLKKLMRNTLFRLSLLGAVLTMLSVAAALGLVYYSMIQTELSRVNESIETEITELQTIYDEAGEAAVNAAIMKDFIFSRPARSNFLEIWQIKPLKQQSKNSLFYPERKMRL